MKTRLKHLPKGDSDYAIWARRGGIKKDWIATIATVSALLYLPYFGYYFCGREKRGLVVNLFATVALLGILFPRESPNLESFITFLRYLLIIYPIYDTYIITKKHEERYKAEFGDDDNAKSD